MGLGPSFFSRSRSVAAVSPEASEPQLDSPDDPEPSRVPAERSKANHTASRAEGSQAKVPDYPDSPTDDADRGDGRLERGNAGNSADPATRRRCPRDVYQASAKAIKKEQASNVENLASFRMKLLDNSTTNVDVDPITGGNNSSETSSSSESTSCGKSSKAGRPRCRRAKCYRSDGQWSRQRRRKELGRANRRRSAPVLLRMGVLNIQSATKEKLPALLFELEDSNLDLVVLCETWFKPGKHIEVPKEYRLIRMDRPDARGGGVAILAKKRLGLKKIRFRQVSQSHPKSKLESLWAHVRIGKRRLVLAAAYRPPRKALDALDADFDELEEYLQDIRIRYPKRPLIICGDLNCDLLKENYLASKEKLSEVKFAYSLSQHVTGQTHSSGSLLDVVLTNTETAVRECTTEDVYGDYKSPHRLVRVVLRLAPTQHKTRSSRPRVQDMLHLPGFRTELKHADWSTVTETETVEEQWEQFLNVLSRVTKSVAATEVEESRSRAAAYRKPHIPTKRLPESSRVHRAAGLTSRRMRERESERDVSAQHGDGMRATPGSASNAEERNEGKTFKLSAISLQDLRSAVFQIQGSETLDVDDLSASVLKAAFGSVGEILLHIVNSSLILAEVPPSWKPFSLRACGARNEQPVLRPRSHIPVMAKVMEIIVHRQLSKYVSDNHLLSNAQHASHRNHSKETALTAISDHILDNTDRGKVSLLGLLNLETGAVQLPRLLEKLDKLGVDTSWFSSYFGGNTERTSDRKTVFEKVPHKMGASHTSPLWSLMCCLFFDGLSDIRRLSDKELKPREVCDSEVFQYVGTTLVIVSGNKQDLDSLGHWMEEQLKAVWAWLGENAIEAKTNSPQMILFGSARNLSTIKQPVSIQFKDCLLQTREEVTILDVAFDKTLNWEAHVMALSANCFNELITLKAQTNHRCERDVETRVERLLLRTMGPISVFGNGTKKTLNRLQKILDFSKKVILSQPPTNDGSAASRLKDWPTAECLVAASTLRLASQVVASGEPRCLANQFVRNQEVRGSTTRQDQQFRLPKPRTNAGRRRFVYRAATAMNQAM